MTKDATRPDDRERLIHALDGMTLEQATGAVRTLSAAVRLYKIGPSLVYQGGLAVAHQLAQAGAAAAGEPVRVFLDMKTWDIPETLRHGLDAVERYGGDAVALVTVHTHGLQPGLLQRGKRPFRVLGVTLLTSQDAGDLRRQGVTSNPADYVLQLAQHAWELGCDGVVCSPLEAAAVRAVLPAEAIVVTPSVRSREHAVAADDQKRALTPREAILAGADYLVIGRPIRLAADPLAAAQALQAEIGAALNERVGNIRG